MKGNFSLRDLSICRKIDPLCLFHKVYYANVTMRERLIVVQTYDSSQLDHQHKVVIPNTNTNALYHSLISHTSLDWNYLPAKIALITDSVLFEKTLDGVLTWVCFGSMNFPYVYSLLTFVFPLRLCNVHASGANKKLQLNKLTTSRTTLLVVLKTTSLNIVGCGAYLLPRKCILIEGPTSCRGRSF